MIPTEKLPALEAAALAWENRPETRCQFAMAGIYQNAGLLPAGLEIPEGDRGWARNQGRSLITPWVEESGFFDTVNPPDVTGLPALPLGESGDLLGFRLGHTLHHVAILLSGGRLVHVFGNHGVKIGPCIPDAWGKRLEKIWRLK